MKLDNKFLKKYKKEMLKIMSDLYPDINDDKLDDIIKETIINRVENPNVELDNNFTGEHRETTVLSVLDWMVDRKPIISGNATFYMNQHEAINPTAKMLENFLSQRKAYKKQMFKVGDPNSPKYKDLDRRQANEKINVNSYYGASGAPSSAFYSLYSGPATTSTAQAVISTAETTFESFIADNYLYLNLTELIEWCESVMKDFNKDDYFVDSFISDKSIYEVAERMEDKIIDKNDNDMEILLKYLEKYNRDQLSVLYYKNNLIKFIDDHDYVKHVIYSIFDSVENLKYADKNDSKWFDKCVPQTYFEEFLDKTPEEWNKFVNTRYFMDPNDVPSTIEDQLHQLSDLLMKYVYSPYLSVDRIYRLKNFKRRVVTVIDTDSNILSLDPFIHFILENVLDENNFGRQKSNNEFIAVNMITYVLTQVIEDALLNYGKASNIPEEYRPIFNMKNEFFFRKLVIGKTKKRYISKIVLREGNLMNPPKKDVKGFDFKKATCSEYSEKFYMGLITKYIIENDSDIIDVVGILRELNNFRNNIKQSIMNGERTYLPNANAKDFAAYKNPESQQVVAAVKAWNYINPTKEIELPNKVSLLKLNIFDIDDISDMKNTYPDIYNRIDEKIFHDTEGIFVTKKEEKPITILNEKLRKKEWWTEIPTKYRSKYKKLGFDAWNDFATDYMNSDEYEDVLKFEMKSKGLQVLAIPNNESIPEWAKPYIDYNVMIDNILSPFIPVLEIFKSKQLIEGKTRKGVDRSASSITNIIKF